MCVCVKRRQNCETGSLSDLYDLYPVCAKLRYLLQSLVVAHNAEPHVEEENWGKARLIDFFFDLSSSPSIRRAIYSWLIWGPFVWFTGFPYIY